MTAPHHAEKTSSARPISPHLQIYRPQLTSMLSIMHRLTGLFLMLGWGGLIMWLWSLNQGPVVYDTFVAHGQSFLGQLITFGLIGSFFYHLSNGIRHLAWDLGYGFDLKTTYQSGWIVLIVTALSTLVCFGAIIWP